jgi:hypothetical protein
MVIDENVVAELNHLSVNDVPSKVFIFCWRLLLERLPTHMTLSRKFIISNLIEGDVFSILEKKKKKKKKFNIKFIF